MYGCVYVCSRRALELEVLLSCSPPARRATAVYFTVTSSVKVAAKYPNCCLSSPLLPPSVRLPPSASVCAPVASVPPASFSSLRPSSCLSFHRSDDCHSPHCLPELSIQERAREPTNHARSRSVAIPRSSMFSFDRPFDGKGLQPLNARSADIWALGCRGRASATVRALLSMLSPLLAARLS